MRTKSIIGVFLLALGVVSFIYQGFQYRTREKVLDVGPIQATAERTHTVPLQPWLGGALIVGGIVVLATGNRRGP